MTTRVPKHISAQYAGGAHGFRREKRRLVREMKTLVNDLRHGCAYFPNGASRPELLRETLDLLAVELSVREWGR